MSNQTLKLWTSKLGTNPYLLAYPQVRNLTEYYRETGLHHYSLWKSQG